MSNFYYCNDCKKPTDLITAGKKLAEYHVDNISEEDKVCFMCWGTNWHAEIDKGTHYEQVRESKIHPGSTHRMGDIEKLNKGEK